MRCQHGFCLEVRHCEECGHGTNKPHRTVRRKHRRAVRIGEGMQVAPPPQHVELVLAAAPQPVTKARGYGPGIHRIGESSEAEAVKYHAGSRERGACG